MRTLSIEVRTVDTAYGLRSALAGFDAEVVEQAGDLFVKVDLSDGCVDIVSVLRAIQEFVTHRQGAPTLIDLDGKTYLMDPSAQR
jgi:predicted secreted protein